MVGLDYCSLGILPDNSEITNKFSLINPKIGGLIIVFEYLKQMKVKRVCPPFPTIFGWTSERKCKEVMAGVLDVLKTVTSS